MSERLISIRTYSLDTIILEQPVNEPISANARLLIVSQKTDRFEEREFLEASDEGSFRT